MGTLTRIVVALAAAGGVALAAAAAPRVPPPTTISSPSPLAGCQDGQDADVVPRAEVEPSLAFDARRPQRIVVVYQEDRFRNGAARAIASSVSADGGRTWRRSVLPVGFCATGASQPFRVTDPWVSIGPDGRVYALASSYAVTSADGGRTWSNPVTLGESSGRFLLDKGSLTADPTRAGTAYAVWARYERPPTGPPVHSDAMLTTTTDGGRLWSLPHVILPGGEKSGPIGSLIVPDPRRGKLYHFAFWQVGAVPAMKNPSRVVVQWSTDRGVSWSGPRTVGQALTVAEESHEAFSGHQIRTGFVVPSLGVDPRSGALYAAWQDARFAGRKRDQIVLARSADGGRTWSRPVRVSGASTQAFVPNVAVTADGTLGIAYFETAAGRSKRAVATRYVLALSRDGGRTFTRVRVGPAFDLAKAPLMSPVPEQAVPPGLFLGDYMGIQAGRDVFRLAFVSTNSSGGDPTDVRYVEVRP
ncbi:MAG TPA: sialidase family protein [Gaiellaceae bacterium]|nr:sialidase family protein [Gaiellaceae bacterium]